MTVLFKPLSGSLNQHKYLPVRYMPLTNELRLADHATYPIIDDVLHSDVTTANTTNVWSSLTVQAICYVITLHSG